MCILRVTICFAQRRFAKEKRLGEIYIYISMDVAFGGGGVAAALQARDAFYACLDSHPESAKSSSSSAQR